MKQRKCSDIRTDSLEPYLSTSLLNYVPSRPTQFTCLRALGDFVPLPLRVVSLRYMCHHVSRQASARLVFTSLHVMKCPIQGNFTMFQKNIWGFIITIKIILLIIIVIYFFNVGNKKIY